LIGIGLDGGGAVLGLRFVGLAIVLVDESAVEVDLHGSAVFGDGAEHVVGHVAGMVGQGAGRGVRGDDGALLMAMVS
jgi:hypothetical protein